jgi:hypothetical protein
VGCTTDDLPPVARQSPRHRNYAGIQTGERDKEQDMETALAADRHRSIGRLGIRLTASVVAIAMAMAISGPAAALPLKRDLPSGIAISVDPSRSDEAASLRAKLRTTAGFRILVYG